LTLTKPTTTDLVEYVEIAIGAADRHLTKLPEAAFRIRGHGSTKVSIFLNELCELIGETNYLEFGVFTGRSLVAAASGNQGRYTGVDRLNWLGSSIRFRSVEDLKAYLSQSLTIIPRDAEHPAPAYAVLEMDFKNYTPPAPNIDVFFYDADHDYAPTRDGIKQILPYMKPGVLIVDDFLAHKKSPQIQQAVAHTVQSSGFVKEWTLTSKQGWHTGLYVAVVE
jgi:predicted O-methyltransferase YrrM